MSRCRTFVTRWLPVLIWMTLIYVASSDPDSGPRGSRLLAPLIRWFVPDISTEALDRTIFFIRKLLHFGEYAVLAFLLMRALSAGVRAGRPWLGTALWALAGAVLYAVSDELHQVFVKNRVASGVDVLIDTAGAVFALGCWRLGQWWWEQRRRGR